MYIAAQNNPMYIISIQSKISRKRCHESALMTAAHILICLTQDGKSIKDIAREDFDNNLELVSVWVDYTVGVNWMRTNNSKNKWAATYEGKKWAEKILSNL